MANFLPSLLCVKSRREQMFFETLLSDIVSIIRSRSRWVFPSHSSQESGHLAQSGLSSSKRKSRGLPVSIYLSFLSSFGQYAINVKFVDVQQNADLGKYGMIFG